MTSREKQEMADLVAQSIASAMKKQENNCPYGIDPITALELRNFAETWKKSRTYTASAFIGMLVIAVGTAIWAGVKSLLAK